MIRKHPVFCRERIPINIEKQKMMMGSWNFSPWLHCSYLITPHFPTEIPQDRESLDEAKNRKIRIFYRQNEIVRLILCARYENVANWWWSTGPCPFRVVGRFCFLTHGYSDGHFGARTDERTPLWIQNSGGIGWSKPFCIWYHQYCRVYYYMNTITYIII